MPKNWRQIATLLIGIAVELWLFTLTPSENWLWLLRTAAVFLLPLSLLAWVLGTSASQFAELWEEKSFAYLPGVVWSWRRLFIITGNVGDLRMVSIDVYAKNNTSRSLTNCTGYIESNTGERVPLMRHADGLLHPLSANNEIAARTTFRLHARFNGLLDEAIDHMKYERVEQVWWQWAEFKFVFECDGFRKEKRFTRKDVGNRIYVSVARLIQSQNTAFVEANKATRLREKIQAARTESESPLG